MTEITFYAFIVFNPVVVAASACGSDIVLLVRLVTSLAVILVVLKVVTCDLVKPR